MSESSAHRSRIRAGTRYLRTATLPNGKRVTVRLYNIWDAMRKRCYKLSSPNYQFYGANGITICDDWREDYDAFRAWAITHGYRKDLTIDRYPDKDGNYEPSNCRWADRETQTYNSNQTKIITFNGETLPSPVWAKRLGIHPTVLRARINQGWTLEHALTTPKGELRKGVQHKPRGRKPKSQEIRA